MSKFTANAQALKSALKAVMKTTGTEEFLDKIAIQASKGSLYLISTNMYILGIHKIDAKLKQKKDFTHVMRQANAKTLAEWLNGKKEVAFSISEKEGCVVFKVKETGKDNYIELAETITDFPNIAQFLEYADCQPKSDELVPATVRAMQGRVIKKAFSIFSARCILDFMQPKDDCGVNKPVYVRQGGALVVVMPVKVEDV